MVHEPLVHLDAVHSLPPRIRGGHLTTRPIHTRITQVINVVVMPLLTDLRDNSSTISNNSSKLRLEVFPLPQLVDDEITRSSFRTGWMDPAPWQLWARVRLHVSMVMAQISICYLHTWDFFLLDRVVFHYKAGLGAPHMRDATFHHDQLWVWLSVAEGWVHLVIPMEATCHLSWYAEQSPPRCPLGDASTDSPQAMNDLLETSTVENYSHHSCPMNGVFDWGHLAASSSRGFITACWF